jgi:hypothetical protein
MGKKKKHAMHPNKQKEETKAWKGSPRNYWGRVIRAVDNDWKKQRECCVDLRGAIKVWQRRDHEGAAGSVW